VVKGCKNGVMPSTKSGKCCKHLYPCKIEGCGRHRHIGGLCLIHLRESLPAHCTFPDCNRKPFTRTGLCQRHGYTCKAENCSKRAKIAGFCKPHALKTTCAVEGCNNVEHKNGKCKRHNSPQSHWKQATKIDQPQAIYKVDQPRSTYKVDQPIILTPVRRVSALVCDSPAESLHLEKTIRFKFF
jgi:hypothetical protein